MTIMDRMERRAIGTGLAVRAHVSSLMCPGVDAGPGVSDAGTAADREEGSTTVEYAIGAVATAGFAGLLLAVLKSGAVKGLLQGIIERALSL